MTALLFALAAWGAAPGPSALQPEPVAPAKPLEEPVFQLPELVIVGENQARILAQKEAFASTPLKGLREAPLLEKEENSVAGLRRRAGLAAGVPDREGLAGVAKVEGGGPAWGGGALWLGDVHPGWTRALAARVSARAGERDPGGVAGGSDEAVAFSGARRGSPVPFADEGSAEAGWTGSSRDLPAVAGGAQRRLDAVEAAGELSRARDGLAARLMVSGDALAAPPGTLGAVGAAASGEAEAWSRGVLALTLRPRLAGESAGAPGSHALAGADAEVAWTPAGAWRGSLGLAADGAFGGGLSAGSVRPLAGLAWTSPQGPVVEAAVAPGFRVPWVTALAPAAPYSWFDRAPVPERDRVAASLSARAAREDGSEFTVAWRYRDTANALSWLELTGRGLWQPVAVADARTSELAAAAMVRQWPSLAVTAEGAWRSVDAGGLELANVPRAEGRLGAEWTGGPWRLGSTLAIVMGRPRSVLGGDLPAYADWGVAGTWRAAPRLELTLRGDNLLGADVEPWGGYPEPKGLVSAGAALVF